MPAEPDIAVLQAAPGQSWDPGRCARTAGFVPALGEPVVDLLAPRPGERILDLGCGDGVLTRKLAAAGARVVGIDSSPRQVAAARAAGIDARSGDGAALAFRGGFDAVFSNAALHWMRDADAVIAGVARALEPGGRFVGEFGGAGNCATIRGAFHAALRRRAIDADAADPWYFPHPAEYRRRLEAHGFTVTAMRHFARPTPLPGDIGDWLETFGESFLRAVPGPARPALRDELRDVLRPALQDGTGQWSADYVRLRFAARL